MLKKNRLTMHHLQVSVLYTEITRPASSRRQQTYVQRLNAATRQSAGTYKLAQNVRLSRLFVLSPPAHRRASTFCDGRGQTPDVKGGVVPRHEGTGKLYRRLIKMPPGCCLLGRHRTSDAYWNILNYYITRTPEEVHSTCGLIAVNGLSDN